MSAANHKTITSCSKMIQFAIGTFFLCSAALTLKKNKNVILAASIEVPYLISKSLSSHAALLYGLYPSLRIKFVHGLS